MALQGHPDISPMLQFLVCGDSSMSWFLAKEKNIFNRYICANKPTGIFMKMFIRSYSNHPSLQNFYHRNYLPE